MARRVGGRLPVVAAAAPAAAAPAPVVVYRGAGGKAARAAAAKIKARALAAAARARRVAYEERHTLVPVLGAAGLGAIKRFLPAIWERLSIGPLSPPAIIGLGGFIAQRMGMRNEWIKGATTAGLAIGAYELVGAIGAGEAGEELPPPPEFIEAGEIGEDEGDIAV